MVTFGFPPKFLTRARSVVDDFMPDDAVVERPGSRTFSEVTGESASGAPTVIYSGVCRFTPTTSNTEAMGNELITWEMTEIYFPWGTPEIRVDDLVTITATSDATSLDRVFRVTTVRHGTYQASMKVTAQAQDRSRTSDNIN